MRVPAFILVSMSIYAKQSIVRAFDLRYTVYIAEVKKRFLYTGLSFLLAAFCAYTQRVSLMYSMTLSLQKALSGESEILNSPAVADKLSSLSSGSVEDIGVVQGLALQAPVRLIFTDVEEAFYTVLSISLFWCFLACFPVLLYHILCFFQPGFYAWQSRAAWFFVCSRIPLAYGTLRVVDLIVIPRLLAFFYSFQIQRDSLWLHAQTKVISYVSMYVFLYSVTILFILSVGVWSFYKRRQILRLLPQALTGRSADTNVRVQQPNVIRSQALDLQKRGDWRRDHYYGDQRGKVWWGCLLVAALVSPPEIFSQLIYALSLILLSEVSVWLAYTSSCRFLNKADFE